jgi:hypothetical protein
LVNSLAELAALGAALKLGTATFSSLFPTRHCAAYEQRSCGTSFATYLMRNHQTRHAPTAIATTTMASRHRLNVFPIRVPSLRERKGDIPLLVEYLVERYAKRIGKKISRIKKKTLDLFQGYDWPGNVRESLHCGRGDPTPLPGPGAG